MSRIGDALTTDWDKATWEAIQEDRPRTAAILSDEALERLGRLEVENETLKETLDEVTMMFRAEDHGWQLIGGLTSGERLEGLDLSELKEISEAIRPHVLGDNLAKRGADLHSGYVWNKGINIAGVKKTGKRGRPAGIVGFFNDPVNQDSLFSATAHEELQKARYSDGNVFLACDTTDSTVRRIPLNQITGIKVNPNFPEEVWAYQRTWNPQTRANSREIKRWYYTNRFSGTKQKSYTVATETVPVDPDVIVVDKRFNRQIGYPLGIPDAVAAMPWIAAYQEIIQYGRVVSESLSRILFKVISNSKAGAKQTAVAIKGMSGFGNTSSMVEGQDVAAIQTAGKGYDFITARPVAAMAATALNVPNMELLADSSAAGSSYGAAAALTPSTKNAMRLMQAAWIEVFYEILDVFSIKTDRIWFDPLEDIDLYRGMQAVTLGAIALSDEEYRGKVLDLLDIAGDPNKIPEILKTRTTAAQTAASPDQGVANGTGGGGQGANDQRTDNIESLRRQMADEELLARWESVVTRMEAASA